MDGAMDGASFMENMQNYDMPARKAILQYLVRMGSFTYGAKFLNEDSGDKDVQFPWGMSFRVLKNLCQMNLARAHVKIPRSLGDRPPRDGPIRIMTWNILAQGLADGIDIFMRCPEKALEWKTRRWQILDEIATLQPDILCMQEVDHFEFFQRAFQSLGYFSTFFPKPESPCLYVPTNNGPDGCAIFVNARRYRVLEVQKRVLEICDFPSNQVAIFCKLRRYDGSELWVATTHLKARSGTIMADLRRQQCYDLLRFIRAHVGDTPLLFTGDLNAEDFEDIHTVFIEAGLKNVYENEVPSYTSWTVRDSGEYAKTLDYIMYTLGAFWPDRILRIPSEQEIGFDRVPSFRYPSDHFSLVADLIMLK